MIPMQSKEMRHKRMAHGGPVESCKMCMGGYADGGVVNWSGEGRPTSGMPRTAVLPLSDSTRTEMEGRAHMAEGGEMDGDHDALMDQCAMECMDAIEKKDKDAFLSSMEALVAGMMMKMNSEQGDSDANGS